VSQQDKAAYYKALQQAGVQFSKHYREYTTVELKEAHDKLVAEQNAAAPVAPVAPPIRPNTDAEAAAFFGFDAPSPAPKPEPAPQQPAAPVGYADPNELAGARQNTNRAENEPIRVDPDTGFTWYQEEVRKPAFAKPRGRRVMKYKDPGVVEQTVKAGEYTETFEISGDMNQAREAEVKITLPSFQVGIYQDPRFPFKTVCYNGTEGFALEDVQDYYGGAELVPEDVKRKYVENVLCYDMRTVIRAIEAEYRQIQLREGATR
jgi:hypothetical protein